MVPAALQENEAFERMRLRLRAISDAARPHIDPRALALRAVLVADRLQQTDLRPQIDKLGRAGACDSKAVEDLCVAARALLYVLSKRGAPSDLGDSAAARAVRLEALEVKRAGIDALETLDDDEVRLWLEVFRLPSDDVSLVFDLRSMALLYDAHASAMGEASDRDARTARRCADALDDLLNTAAAESEWTQWVAPAFTLTLALYQEGCRIGRFLSSSDALGLSFPSTANIARARRRRGPSSFSNEAMRRTPPPLPTVTETVDEVDEAELESVPELWLAPGRASAPTLVPVPSLAPAPADEELARASFPPDSDRAHRDSTRRGIELEVGLLSESNFYVGFTENLSESGVFVATYLVRPLGSKVELSLQLLGRDAPLKLRGEVRWVRLYSPTSDAGPGMGIRFESISEADRAEITKFLTARDPIFFPE
jgi:uncharacterized protein (TIGR02266 family)